MLSTMVIVNPMVLVGTMLESRYLMKSDYVFIKYNDPNMVPTNTMGFRVPPTPWGSGSHRHHGVQGHQGGQHVPLQLQIKLVSSQSCQPW